MPNTTTNTNLTDAQRVQRAFIEEQRAQRVLIKDHLAYIDAHLPHWQASASQLTTVDPVINETKILLSALQIIRALKYIPAQEIKRYEVMMLPPSWGVTPWDLVNMRDRMSSRLREWEREAEKFGIQSRDEVTVGVMKGKAEGSGVNLKDGEGEEEWEEEEAEDAEEGGEKYPFDNGGWCMLLYLVGG